MIALVGKYAQLKDSYASVNKALLHASLKCNLKLVLELIDSEDLEEATKVDKSKAHKYFDAWKKVCNCK